MCTYWCFGDGWCWFICNHTFTYMLCFTFGSFYKYHFIQGIQMELYTAGSLALCSLFSLLVRNPLYNLWLTCRQVRHSSYIWQFIFLMNTFYNCNSLSHLGTISLNPSLSHNVLHIHTSTLSCSLLFCFQKFLQFFVIVLEVPF